jgi:hypothetical protein
MLSFFVATLAFFADNSLRRLWSKLFTTALRFCSYAQRLGRVLRVILLMVPTLPSYLSFRSLFPEE